MEDEDFLLDDAKILQDRSILDMIQWWERNRLWYNLIVGIVGLLTSIIIIQLHHFTTFSEILWYAALPYGVFANVAYLAGWVTELLLRYYLKITLSLSSRRTLLGLGTTISILPFVFIMLILLQ